MAVLIDDTSKELIITCDCGCENGLHININVDDIDLNIISYMSYINGNFYRDQNSLFSTIKNKFKKVWAIIRNKDYCYSDIIMTKSDFIKYRNYLNGIV